MQQTVHQIIQVIHVQQQTLMKYDKNPLKNEDKEAPLLQLHQP